MQKTPVLCDSLVKHCQRRGKGGPASGMLEACHAAVGGWGLLGRGICNPKDARLKRIVWMVWVVLLLVGAGQPTWALTLGGLRGVVLLGRSLDVSVQIVADANESVTASCVTAEVYYADARQINPAISLSPNADGVLARVQLTTPVTEPVVSVALRVACGTTSQRRYVLLADFPGATAQAGVEVTALHSAPMLVLPQSMGPSVSQAMTPAVAPAPAASAPAEAPTRKHPHKHAKRPTPAESAQVAAASGQGAAPGPAQFAAPRAAKPAAGRAVLKLDPMDLFSDRVDSLDTATLFAPPADALRQARDIASLQGDAKALRELAARHEARIADLTTQLQEARSQQAPLWLLEALLALVVLCLGAVGWLLWDRHRDGSKARQWWRESDDSPATAFMAPPTRVAEPVQAPVGAAAPAGEAAVPKPVISDNFQTVALKTAALQAPLSGAALGSTGVSQAGAAGLSQPVQEVDLDLDLDSFMLSDAARSADAGQASASGGVHIISSEAVMDIRQQAEFFVSLGQTDRAQRILQKHLDDNEQANPLIYLDLLTLYQSMGQKLDFRALRTQFLQHFNADLPDFPAFTLEGKGLEGYPETLERITQAWSCGQALGVLDACIFRQPAQAHGHASFDTAAFKDLLLLHTLAEEVMRDSVDLPREVPQAPMLDMDLRTQPVEPLDASMLPAQWPAPTSPAVVQASDIFGADADLPPLPEPAAEPDPLDRNFEPMGALAPVDDTEPLSHVPAVAPPRARRRAAVRPAAVLDPAESPADHAPFRAEPPEPEPAPMPELSLLDPSPPAPVLADPQERNGQSRLDLLSEPLPDELSLMEDRGMVKDVGQTPSKYLDLDFSRLVAPDEPDTSPAARTTEPSKPSANARYATRARYSTNTKPKS